MGSVVELKYLGSTLTSDGTSNKEVEIRIAVATAAMTKLQEIWKSKISLNTKIRLYRSLVLSIFLYGCETWTLYADTERRIQAFEMKCYRKILRVLYTEHRTNNDIREEISAFTGRQEPLLAIVKRRKLAWFGHTTRHDSLCKTVLQGTVDGGRRRGRQRKSWMCNIKEWTSLPMPELLATAEDRSTWRKMAVSSSRKSPLRRPSQGTE